MAEPASVGPEQLMVELARLHMCRVRQGGMNKSPERGNGGHTLVQLQTELDMISQAMLLVPASRSHQPCEAMQDEQVLRELWEEADDALVRVLADPATQTAGGIAAGILPVLAGAQEEAHRAVEGLARDILCHPKRAKTAWEWSAETCEDAAVAMSLPPERRSSATLLRDGRPPATAAGGLSPRPPTNKRGCHEMSSSAGSRQGPSAPVGQVGTSVNSGRAGGNVDPVQQHDDASQDSESAVAPRPSSFQTASSLLPPHGREQRRSEGAKGRNGGPTGGGGKGGAHTGSVNMEAVNAAVLGKRSVLDKKRPAQSSSGSDEQKQRNGSAREWSEDWLRIADADQLERIVPALEATIHKGGAGERVKRGDIAGLKFVKSQIEEVLILPQLHPQLFSSALTRPARGLLLFGPPGTGKTMVARWIAAECGATFFNIHASTVMSKWVGEAEKTVKALFQLARERQPSVIFVDEIDSLLSKRRDADNEGSRRVKNEFLTSLEGADTPADEKVLLVGATNLPWELDTAALRRLQKRLYVPLPCKAARIALLKRQLVKHSKSQGLADEGLSSSDLEHVASLTDGFSGSDLQVLLREAAMIPVREARAALTGSLRRRAAAKAASPSTAAPAGPRNVRLSDLEAALQRVSASFSSDEAKLHHEFNEAQGTFKGKEAMLDADDNENDEDEDDDDPIIVDNT